MELTERTRADWIQWQLGRAIAARLRNNPEEIRALLLSNIQQVKDKGRYGPVDAEWENLLQRPIGAAIYVLECDDPTSDGQRLRSNLRSWGILPEEQRIAIISASNGRQPFSEALIQPA